MQPSPILDVEIGVERAKVMNGAASECQLIIECSNILQIPDEFERPQLEPLLMVQEGGEMPFAVTKQCGLVGVHPQVLPDQKIINAFLENNMQVFFPQMEWPEFAMIGHSVEGRVIRAPRWFSQAWNETQDIEKVALTLQRFGRDVAGFAIVKGHLENGVILLPIDKDDLKECGEIFFPFEIKRAESDFDYTVSPCFSCILRNIMWNL
ncbi:unnamed protein product [Anisakis simplex]|uniref:ATP-grasp domain-containing protein n=1 Tax=Anisakis simplex TaxID=6269 RepID=A0A0M3J796_ANISI|nr:unnamed protein product [Anisakis simplex]